ncbi:MAG: hypothetical protein DYG93_05250 [Leptolyngbya sp. PLA2]|nr:hypothetical protein [Leptolyngbya sp.]MCE7971054.1 hypothetical protein [Leptolyngbya sp. PL-A2]MCZ7631873.1 hypothetical protein [Phycisphaerales bacterium]MDL1905363.1 hypothetical protein [Synechococcales cyanobacterium CNB]GIK20322.1 MAG: hypothetical protein BroJett004_24860 [Planctomycetota bacterium]
MSGADRDILISRALDGEATPEDWSAFRAMADRDPAIWRELAEAQQDRAELAAAVAHAVAVADDVSAPIEEHLSERLTFRIRTVAAWGGWALAAGLALAAFIGPRQARHGTDGQNASLVPGLVRINTPQDALDAYYNRGQADGTVLGELPERIVLQTTPVENGLEVIYVRQIVERLRADDFYRLGYDEAGQPVPVRFEPTPRPTRAD